MACSDGYAFRWYLTESLARMLDDANVIWRPFVIGKTGGVPAAARPYLEPCAAVSQAGLPAGVRFVS
jgi:hypothetical protein